MVVCSVLTQGLGALGGALSAWGWMPASPWGCIRRHVRGEDTGTPHRDGQRHLGWAWGGGGYCTRGAVHVRRCIPLSVRL